MNLSNNICIIPFCKCNNIHINTPKYTQLCKYSVFCSIPNCYFTHPPDRVKIHIVHDICMNGNNCRNKLCNLMHYERVLEHHIKKKTVKCKFGPNCTTMNTCQFKDHSKAQFCRFGEKCATKTTCLWSHNKGNSVCSYGEKCDMGDKCLHKYHSFEAFNEFNKIQHVVENNENYDLTLLDKSKKQQAVCMHGKKCKRLNTCWFAFHSISEFEEFKKTDFSIKLKENNSIPLLDNTKNKSIVCRFGEKCNNVEKKNCWFMFHSIKELEEFKNTPKNITPLLEQEENDENIV
jgi:hypothetical protein